MVELCSDKGYNEAVCKMGARGQRPVDKKVGKNRDWMV